MRKNIYNRVALLYFQQSMRVKNKYFVLPLLLGLFWLPLSGVRAIVPKYNVGPYASGLLSGSSFQSVFGNSGFDELKAVARDGGSGFIAAGRTTSSSGNIDAVLLRLDAGGQLVWQQTYGDQETEELYDVIPTEDGGFLAVGSSDSYGSAIDMKGIWLLKVDGSGKQLWYRFFGGETTIDEGMAIAKSIEGDGYVILGTTISIQDDNPQNDIILLKVDKNGNKIWSVTHGGEGNEQGNAIIATAEGYTIAGSTESYGKGKWDAWLLHVDVKGNKVWDSTMGGGDSDVGNDVLLLPDGGYLLAGYTYSFAVGSMDAWIVRTDAKGKEIWNKVFGGVSTDEFFRLCQTKDGNFVAAGYTEVWMQDENGSNISNEDHNAFMVKVDIEGNRLWEKSLGGEHEQRVFDVVMAQDGGVVTVGLTKSNERNGADMLVLKIADE